MFRKMKYTDGKYVYYVSGLLEMSNIQYANERLIQNHWAIIDIELKTIK